MQNKLTYFVAGCLLFLMFLAAFFSMQKDALTFDELAHIPAGYSYLSQQDYRVNPEHPPLIKDLSALPLLFLDLNFPSESQVWKQTDSAPAWWIQFDLGTKFIYDSGNNPVEIIFWSRLPIIAILLILGFFIFKWTKELAGNLPALMALTLFVFSPNFLAHGRLVTTDVGAALGTVLATYFWLKFLYAPGRKNIILASVFLGLAMLMKFSLILLIPFFGLITIAFSLLNSGPNKLKILLNYVLKAVLIGIIALIFVIWPVYQIHTLNYPAEHQLRDTSADLAPNQMTALKNINIWMSDKPILRPIAQYMRGIMMATQRTVFGNTVYFLGEISASAWWYYFPVIYFLKVPLAFHLLTLLVLKGLILTNRRKIFLGSFKSWIKNNFTVFSLILFVLFYWLVAITSNLNIGIRHILPIFPFTYILVVLGLKKLIATSQSFKKPLLVIVLLSVIWYAGSSVSAFPNYIPYYNEAAGGQKEEYKYAVDSNYDWGQDFYKLVDFVKENNIEKIHLDYFGGESPEYWLGEKYLKLNPKEIKSPPKGWIAVSVNQLQGGTAKPVPEFDQETGYYDWLTAYNPVKKIGYTILVYYIE